MRTANTLALTLSALVLASLANGQPYPSFERGFAPEKMYQFSNVDTVNLLNGNLIITIPIGPAYPVSERFSYRLSLVFNSKVWDYQQIYAQGGCVEPRPVWHSNAGMGWRLTLGELIAPADPTNDITNIPGPSNPPPNNWEYIGNDGAEHRFYATLHVGETPDPNGYYFYTRDGSYLRMRYVTSNAWAIDFPDGTYQEYVYQTWPDGSTEWRISTMGDQFDSPGDPSVSITYPHTPTSDSMKILDRVGRTQTITYMADSTTWYPRLVQSVTLTAFNGTTVTYDFSYVLNQNLSLPITRSGCLNWPPTTAAYALSNVALPDGTNWTFQTDPANGVVTSLGLPTGGQIDYTYSTVLFPVAGCSGSYWQIQSGAVGSRTFWDLYGTNLGTWIYSAQLSNYPVTHLLCGTNDYEQSPAEEEQVTVTSPLGHKSVHYFSVFPGWNGNPDYTTGQGYQGLFHPEEFGLPLSHNPASDNGVVPQRFLSVQEYNCQPPQNPTCPSSPVRATYLRYDRDPGVLCGAAFGPDCLNSNRILAGERTVFLDDPQAGVSAPCADYSLASGSWSDTTCRSATTDNSSFDGLGHYRTTTTGGTFDAGNQRTTTTDYNPGSGTFPGSWTTWPTSNPWVVNTYDYQQVIENSVTAETKYCFNSSTGYLNGTRTLTSGTTESASDLVTTYTPDSAGNTTSERYFGGDTQGLGTVTQCSANPQGYQYRVDHTYQYGMRNSSRYVDTGGTPASFFSLDEDIDLNTDLVSRSRDTAGIYTDFTYDAMNRVTWVKPQTGSSNGGAWVQNVITNVSGTYPAKVNLYAYANGSTTNPLAQEEYSFDGFGRVAKERQLLDSGAWNQRLFQYNAQGWKTSVSEAQPDGTSGSGIMNTQYLNYDPFGRVSTIQPPDGAPHDITLTYTGVRQVTRQVSIATTAGSEAAVTSTETYDRQGRLWSVAEFSDATAPTTPITTTYGYDVGNRLTSVTTGAQVRGFTYDNRGLMLFEDVPEKTIPAGRSGACANHTVCYSNYDARGHAGRVQDGANDLTFAYDPEERLTTVSVTGSNPPYLKTFLYAIASTTSDWANGKLRSSTMTEPPSTGVAAVTESYTYGGAGGAISQKTTQIGLTSSSTGNLDPPVSFSQNYTWTDLGQVASLTYPGMPGVAPNRTVYQSFTNGFLTAVLPEYANSITYQVNGMMASVVHANGVTDTQTIADGQNGRPADWMARPITIGSASGGTSLWSTGTYAYDGVGNIKAMNTDTFVYDKVSRLTAASLTVGGFAHTQAYAFDVLGNMTSVTTDGSPLSFAIAGTSNRIGNSGWSYDNAGNATGWVGGANTYVATYDPLDKLASMSGLGINRLYAYDADGERTLIRDINFNPVIYTIDLRDLDQKVIRELTYTPSAPPAQAWSWIKDYVYRSGALLASVGANEGTRHYSLDHLGTPRLLTNRCGQQYALFSYFPFGDEITGGNQDGTERMRFTGHERDLGLLDRTSDDLDYMHARYYKPVTAERFLSVDPVGGYPHSPQSWNRYSYVSNNPMRIADPTGLVENDYNDSTPPSVGGGTNPASRAQEAGQNAAKQARVDRLVNAQDAAMNNPNLQPGVGGHPTHCNQGTCAVAAATGAPMGPLTNSHGTPLHANEIVSNLAKPESGYKPVSAIEAQRLANQGTIVLVAGPDHVATVRPDTIPGQQVPGKGPVIANVGKVNGVLRLNYVFTKNALPAVKFYTPSE